MCLRKETSVLGLRIDLCPVEPRYGAVTRIECGTRRRATKSRPSIASSSIASSSIVSSSIASYRIPPRKLQPGYIICPQFLYPLYCGGQFQTDEVRQFQRRCDEVVTPSKGVFGLLRYEQAQATRLLEADKHLIEE